MSDADGIALRFSLAAQLNRMRYGNARVIGADMAHKAWPPTGDHDRTFEGAFRAMSLAASGNRPEASYTTEERIIRDLDDSFVVDRRPEDGSWVINRLISRCPHCRGAGFVRDFLPVTAEFVEGYASVDAAEVIEVKTTKCDHPAA